MQSPTDRERTPVAEKFLAGGGEMDALMRSKEWSATPLGPVEPRPEEVAPLMREACETFASLAKERALELDCDVSEDLPPILADRGRILQVLSNLVGNALKFTPDGGRITLRA